VLDDAGVKAKPGGKAESPLEAKPARHAIGDSGMSAVDAFATLPRETLVGHVGERHALVLNKYPVMPHHCVLVTRAFVPQAGLMGEEDTVALWRL
jgi:ATP adenylyltransferase